MIKRIIIILILVFSVNAIYAHHGIKRGNIKRTNNYFSYKDQVNEFGTSINVSYLRYSKKFAPTLQMHYAHYLTKFFSLGIGYNGTFSDNMRNTFTIEPSLRIYEGLLFTFKPGMSLKTENNKTTALYSIGFSTNYELPISEKMHIGPRAEFNIVQDELIYSFGLHVGFTF